MATVGSNSSRPPSQGRTLPKIVTVKRKPTPFSLSDEVQKQPVFVARPATLPAVPAGTSTMQQPTILEGTIDQPLRYDEKGRFVQHSILGSLEDYEQILGSPTTKKVLPPRAPLQKSLSKLKMEEKQRTNPAVALSKNEPKSKEEKYLEAWTQRVQEWRHVGTTLSRTIDRPADTLAMNNSSNYRAMYQHRDKIDRAEALDDGKGQQTGVEFWKVPEKTAGLTMTLTLTERGLQPPFEFISRPAAIQDTLTDTVGGPDWLSRSSYLRSRYQDLEQPLDGVYGHEPDFGDLVVLGTHIDPPSALRQSPGRATPMAPVEEVPAWSSLPPTPHLELTTSHEHVRESNPLMQLFGPPVPQMSISYRSLASHPPRSSLLSGDVALETAVLEPLDEQRQAYRVLFNGAVATQYHVHLVLHNNSNVVLYYSWQPMPKESTLSTHRDKAKRFYFDHKPGVLLPGEERLVRVTFSSPNQGLFSEAWVLAIDPCLYHGSHPSFTFHGVATSTDRLVQSRQSLNSKIEKQAITRYIERFVLDLVSCLTVPPREASPDTSLHVKTLQQTFADLNHPLCVFYSKSVVDDLAALYLDACLEVQSPGAFKVVMDPVVGGTTSAAPAGKSKGRESKGRESALPPPTGPPPPPTFQIQRDAAVPALGAPPAPWSLSVRDLQNLIMSILNEGVRSKMLETLNTHVAALSTPPLVPLSSTPLRHDVCAGLLRQLFDDVDSVGHATYRRLGIPTPPLVVKGLAELAPPDPKGAKGGRKGSAVEKKPLEKKKPQKSTEQIVVLSEEQKASFHEAFDFKVRLMVSRFIEDFILLVDASSPYSEIES